MQAMAETERVEQVEYGDSPWYRWTIRTLYAVAIGLNVWILWDAIKDDTETAVFKAQVKQTVAKALGPFHHEREVQKQTGRMLWEATQIVEAASE
jgi:hypothetical protein